LATPDSADHERVRGLVSLHWTEASTITDFVKGYAAHLLTDRLWYDTIITPFRESMSSEKPFEELRSLYYLETDQVDFNLYHQLLWRAEVWTKLAAASPEDFAPLLTAKEIGLWRDRTLNWFGGLKQEPGINPSYITDNQVRLFIDQATEMIMNYFTAWKTSVLTE
jgi:hypothetical protein